MPFKPGQSGNPAGRPRKAEKYAGQIAAAEDRIADRLPELIDNLFVLASGVLVEDVNPIDGSTSVYREPPDRKANEYLIDRILGRPSQAVELSGESGEPLRILVEYADPASDPAPPASGATPGDAGGAAIQLPCDGPPVGEEHPGGEPHC